MKNQTKYVKKSQNVGCVIGRVIGNNSQAFQPMWLGDAAQAAKGTSLLYERVQTDAQWIKCF